MSTSAAVACPRQLESPSATGVPERNVPGLKDHGRYRRTILRSRMPDDMIDVGTVLISHVDNAKHPKAATGVPHPRLFVGDQLVGFCMMHVAHAYDSRSIGGELASADTAIAVEAGEHAPRLTTLRLPRRNGVEKSGRGNAARTSRDSRRGAAAGVAVGSRCEPLRIHSRLSWCTSPIRRGSSCCGAGARVPPMARSNTPS